MGKMQLTAISRRREKWLKSGVYLISEELKIKHGFVGTNN